MMNLKLMRVFTALCCLAITGVVSAEENSAVVWVSLEESLEFAKSNSITLRQAELEVESSASQELSARGAFLPTVSGYASQSIVGYPADSNSSYAGSYGVDLTMTLYNGGSSRASLKKSVIGTQIAGTGVDLIARSLEVSITEVYVEILYAIEQIKVAQQSLVASEKSEERGKAYLEVGSINEADFAQLQSSTAQSKYDIIEAETQLSTLYVALKHLLEISQDVTLRVKLPDLSDEVILSPIPSITEVYEVALEERPEIQSSKLYVDSAVLDESIARAGYLPKLSLTAGTGVNHSSGSDYTFSTQLRSNFNTSAGLSLSVPIFSGYKNRSNVAIAQNNTVSASLSLTQAEKDLYQTIETLHSNATNAQAKYSVSEYLLKANERSLELAMKQYEVGIKSVIDLITEQDNYNQTQQEHLINKYRLILNKALLNYYKTNIIKL